MVRSRPRAGADPSGARRARRRRRRSRRRLGGDKLFAYIENSYTFNLTGAGRGGTNELRFYDYDEGYTFNTAEFSIKKDPTERYWWGYGLVLSAGLDAQKNHSLGIFRDDDDTFAFRNTPKVDLQEAYGLGADPARGAGSSSRAASS